MRTNGRKASDLRPIKFEPGFVKHPAGSCLVRMGETWVLCTATIEEKVPPFLEGKNVGWVTAEYAMLPGSTNTRNRRESSTGRPNGRSQEIQRLIGRALRACVNTQLLGSRSVLIDCDVLQADGGTRVASINGSFVALSIAVQTLLKKKSITTNPITSSVAAVSVGMKAGEVLVDLDYGEDSSCDVDMNVVQLEGGKFVELQGTAEGTTFSREQADQMLTSATKAIFQIIEEQKAILTKFCV